jgi:hypothetical protein
MWTLPYVTPKASAEALTPSDQPLGLVNASPFLL